jgi:hypothetical protein
MERSWFQPIRANGRWLWLALVGLVPKIVLWLLDNIAGNWATNKLDALVTRWGAASLIAAKVVDWTVHQPVGTVVIIGV